MPQFNTSGVDAIRRGDIQHGMWMMTNSSDLARISSSVGYDYVCIDMQHGYGRISDLLRLSDAIRAGGDSLVAVRVPENDFTQIGLVADAGAEIILVPLVNSADDARAAVSALNYPDTAGTRSWGPANVIMMAEQNTGDAIRPLLLVMIETAEGLANLEEITSVDGVDGLYIGPADLSFAVGSRPGPEEPATSLAIEQIHDVAKKHGKIAACHTSAGTEASKRREQGFTFITTAIDAVATRAAFSAELDAGKEARS